MITTQKSNFVKITATLSILLIAYFIAALLQSDTWGNILSPISTFAVSGILYFVYLRSDRTIKVSICLLFFAFACTFWGIADVIWAIISFIGGVPDENPVIWVTYALTNCFFMVSLLVFTFQQFRKWDIVQLSIALLVSGFISIFLFWILFLHKDITILYSLLASDFTSILSILTDIIICISIISWIVSVRGGKIPSFLLMILSGLLLFAIVDLIYYYLDLHGLYVPNSMLDFLYMLSLVLVAFGALWKTYKSSSVLDLSVIINISGRGRWMYLLLFPALLVTDVVTGFVPVRLSVGDFFAVNVPILFYWVACKYIQFSLEKEALLKHSNEMLEERVAEQVSELTYITNKDTLTTLFNRRYFIASLDDALKTRRSNELIALLLIDLDRFKTINDTFSHDVGDKVLIDLSYRMIEWNSYGATIARIGGDEFAVLFVGKYSRKDVEVFCTELMNICEKPIVIDLNEMSLTISIGVAIVMPEEDCDGMILLQNADIAIYRAKSHGYNKYLVYDPFMSKDFKKTAEIEVQLRQADAEKDFELYYQPQFSLPGKKLIGAEALIRWKNSEHGYIPPNIFIPIAEQIDYIYKIGKWVLHETIRQSIVWNKRYVCPLKVGFNVSPKQFQDENFITLMRDLVADSGINPSWIDAEITESVMMGNIDEIDDIFSSLRELGISVSVDDFGSGYSALGYLNKFPFDRIKIDKSLVDNINSHNVSGANVIKAAITMAHASGFQVIAEGVETQEQLEILIELGCDQVQGYLLGRPVPADVFEQIYIKKYHNKIS